MIHTGENQPFQWLDESKVKKVLFLENIFVY